MNWKINRTNVFVVFLDSPFFICIILDMMKDERKRFTKDEPGSNPVVQETVPGNTRINIPIYQRFKGKSLHGSKTWKLTEKERKNFNLVVIVFIALVFLGFALPFFSLPPWITFILFFVLVILAVGIPWLYMIKLFRKYNKQDPMEIHYYDVDYKDNRLTGESYDQTKEITKEEFFGKTELSGEAQELRDSSSAPLPFQEENPFEK